MSRGSGTWPVFRELVREEWRLHAELFGGRRFAPFPVVVAALTALAVGGAAFGGTDAATLVVSVHLLVLGFGAYTGTAGLVGTDMLEHVLGDVTLLLSSARVLPVSRRRLLGLFLLKDELYYAGLFLAPMALGFAPLVAAGGLAASTLPALWLSLTLTFSAGLASSFSGVALLTRGVRGRWLAAAAGLAGVAAWRAGLLPAVVAVAVPIRAGVPAAVSLAVAALVVGAAALAVYDPTYRPPARTADDRFRPLQRRLPDPQGLVAKSVLDVARSTGGLWKPVVSVGILLGVAAGLAALSAVITGLRPAPGVFYGGIVGLSAFTSYNWLTQFDDVESYLAYPVSVAALFRAKRTAFLAVGGPVALAGYAVAVAATGTALLDAAVGAVLAAGLSLYFFGLTVALAGFDPNAFLFDPARFAAFFVGVAVPLVPVLLAGFAVAAGRSSALLGAVAVVGVVAGGVGAWLSEYAARRWTRHYAAG
ncbi:hypothetical protein [Halobaculum sp. D14]|uniref:hypothetical protein n=1 Tax=Halobaculum sp. D14 TaxID=3421642 RepID=UPI003EBCB04B